MALLQQPTEEMPGYAAENDACRIDDGSQTDHVKPPLFSLFAAGAEKHPDEISFGCFRMALAAPMSDDILESL